MQRDFSRDKILLLLVAPAVVESNSSPSWEIQIELFDSRFWNPLKKATRQVESGNDGKCRGKAGPFNEPQKRLVVVKPPSGQL